MAMEEMKDGLSLHPQQVTDQLWYYEQPRGVIFVHEIRDEETGEYIRTDQIRIPWGKLKVSVGRRRRYELIKKHRKIRKEKATALAPEKG